VLRQLLQETQLGAYWSPLGTQRAPALPQPVGRGYAASARLRSGGISTLIANASTARQAKPARRFADAIRDSVCGPRDRTDDRSPMEPPRDQRGAWSRIKVRSGRMRNPRGLPTTSSLRPSFLPAGGLGPLLGPQQTRRKASTFSSMSSPPSKGIPELASSRCPLD